MRPVTDTPAARALCERLVAGRAPIPVAVDAPPWAQPNECIANVRSVADRFGGLAEYGWALWELPGVFVEAEFHAIWRDGSVRWDVTPRPDRQITRIHFLPDPTLSYEGRQIDNMRLPIADDETVREFIAASEAWYEITNRGELADYHGPLRLKPGTEMHAAYVRRQRAELGMLTRFFGVPQARSQPGNDVARWTGVGPFV